MYSNGCKPCSLRKAATRKVVMRFLREELIYDIRNCAYIEGEVVGEDAQHAQHTLVAIGEEGNIDRVTRMLGVIHAAAVEMLHPFTKAEPLEEETTCDRLWEPEEYVIESQIPQTFSRTTLHLLHKLIHEYMVCRVLHEWLSTTNPDAAPKWLAKSEEAKEKINSIKHNRTGVQTRPSHPF